METDRSGICGCKGIRTCLKCEKLFGIDNRNDSNLFRDDFKHYFYCSKCDTCWPSWDGQDHDNHQGEPFYIDGVYLLEDFLTEDEENRLLTSLDDLPWDSSQSGRRKQNFGPKCNFKKRKLRVGDFQGFPASTKFVQEKFKDVELLKDFQTIEQCSLEYDPNRGASIDRHIDDCWIWGERIVTVNLLSDSVLTLTKYIEQDSRPKYNLHLALESREPGNTASSVLIRIPMPRRSLLVLTGEARYRWEHQIFRDDIITRRVCLAYREFTLPYLPGGDSEHEGAEVMRIARDSWL
uniref:Putative alpha-ketoglutarate-dependent dioxygenase ABH4 n=1 Tax=Lygus hesperus TaxID=30085 RepID=A0A146M525_LYGHE